MSDVTHDAVAALKARGFVEKDDGTLVEYRNGAERTRYVLVGGGFERHFKGERMVHSMLPEDDPVFDGLPPSVRNGVDADKFPRFFQWVWPAEDIVSIYG